jgi:hypothetical protein
MRPTEFRARLAQRDLAKRAVCRAHKVGLLADREGQEAGPAVEVSQEAGVAEEAARGGAVREVNRKESPRSGAWTG